MSSDYSDFYFLVILKCFPTVNLLVEKHCLEQLKVFSKNGLLSETETVRCYKLVSNVFRVLITTKARPNLSFYRFFSS